MDDDEEGKEEGEDEREEDGFGEEDDDMDDCDFSLFNMCTYSEDDMQRSGDLIARII